MTTKPSDVCRTTGFQACHHCDDLDCGDNTGPRSAVVVEVRSSWHGQPNPPSIDGSTPSKGDRNMREADFGDSPISTQDIDDHSAELMRDFYEHYKEAVAHMEKNPPSATWVNAPYRGLVFESWAIQKLSSLQLLVFEQAKDLERFRTYLELRSTGRV